MTDFGPFSVDPARIAALGGANFGQFINRLLATEVAAHGMRGTTLETTYMENVGDGGVDAGLRDASGTVWIPSGDSAWQFKAGDLEPAACKAELRGADRAKEVLLRGGSYRLVLGATRTSQMVARRRDALVETAREFGVEKPESKIEVIVADGLARWTETYPGLAISPLLGGIGRRALSFAEWSNSHPHDTTWTTSERRNSDLDGLRNSIASSSSFSSRIEGVSGLGKSRLALEAVRGQPYEPLVIYAPSADQFPIDVLIQLRSQDRVAVVIIDECDRKEHEVFASSLAVNSSVRIVTIGEPASGATRTPILSLTPFNDEAMRELLRVNRPSLSPEAERVVLQIAVGNIDYALKLAQVAIDRGGAAGQLITEDDLRTFFASELPGGQLFLGSCALALFSRFGAEGEPAEEIDLIARGLGLDSAELLGALAELQRRGLVSKQGRYRTVGPHPVAVFLAARGWEEFGSKIVSDLLPLLDADFIDRLFRRAVDVGELDAASPAMRAVLDAGGPLGSLASIAAGDNSGLLVHFSVLAPTVMADRLSELIGNASEAELRQASSVRRDLVWALEKLAWHTSTFVTAADAMLRLAIAENESYSNNASGTWVEFFGTMLPGTAAPPDVRMAYLTLACGSDDPRVRLLVGRAADRALEPHESIMVAGEVQGGVVVEPRGRPATYGEIWSYRNSAIDILARLSIDPDKQVAELARKSLVSSIHGLLEVDANRDHLGASIAQLPSEVVARARIEVESLRSLFDRVDVNDGRPEALDKFESTLPRESAEDRLAVLGHSRTWDREVSDVAQSVAELARQIDLEDPSRPLVEQLESSPDLPAAYAMGRAMKLLGIEYGVAVERLREVVGTPNGEAIVGFLHALMEDGDTEAFDRFLGAGGLEPLTALQYSVRGPRTSAATARVDQLVQQVSVAAAARLTFAWMHQADERDAARYLSQWTARIETQADYNAAVDFAAMRVFNKEERFPHLDPVFEALVPLIEKYPKVGQESWDWSVLVRRQLRSSPIGVVRLLADLIEMDAISAFSGSEEDRLLQDAVALAGEAGWLELMDRLERGEWRLSFSVDNWLGNAVEANVAERWVGESLERARVLAGVTKPGGRPLSETARFLIDNFGHDDRVPSQLVGQFISGMWSGNESDRIASQMEDVRSWIDEPGQSSSVRSWGRKLLEDLDTRRRAVLEAEAEGGW